MPKNPKQSSKKVASDAGKALKKGTLPKKDLEFPASVLAQAPLKKKPKSK